MSSVEPSKLHARTSCDGWCELDRAKAEWKAVLCTMGRAIAEQEALRQTVFPLQPMDVKVSALLAAYSSVSRCYSKRLADFSTQASPDSEIRPYQSTTVPAKWTLDRVLTWAQVIAYPTITSQSIIDPPSPRSGMTPEQEDGSILARRASLWNDIQDDYTDWLDMTDQLRAVLVQATRVRNTVTADERKAFMRLIDHDASARRQCLESLIRAWGTTCGPEADEWDEFCYDDGTTVELVPPPWSADNTVRR